MKTDKSDIMDDLQELQDKVDGMGFMGSNENDLFRREEISDYIIKNYVVIDSVKRRCFSCDSLNIKLNSKNCECDKPTLQSQTRQCGECKFYIDKGTHILLTNPNDEDDWTKWAQDIPKTNTNKDED